MDCASGGASKGRRGPWRKQPAAPPNILFDTEPHMKMIQFRPLRFWAAIIMLTLALQIFSQPHATSTQEKRWYKGNTHTHTVNSDGDSTPDEVIRWYREHGYNFLVLSDHNYLTEVDGLNAVFGAPGKFIVIRGEEVSDKFQEKPIHLNGLN